MSSESDVIVSRHHVSMTWDKVIAIVVAVLSVAFSAAWHVLSEAKEKATIGIATLNLERERLTDRVIQLELKVESQAEEKKLLHDLNDKVTRLATQFDDHFGDGRGRRGE